VLSAIANATLEILMGLDLLYASSHCRLDVQVTIRTRVDRWRI